MKRPRPTLSLFNPRRRLRDRLLAAMLAVALVPAGAFFVLTAVDLNGITQSTVSGAFNGLVSQKENAFQTDLGETANTVIDASLRALQVDVSTLATNLVAATTTPPAATPSPGAAGAGASASPAVTGSPSPAATASPSPSANPTPASTTLPASDAAYEPVGPGVNEVTPASSAAAELLVGTGSGTEGVRARAATLASLSAFAAKQLADVKLEVGSSIDVDAVWIMDQADNAVWVSPAVPSVPQVQGLAANPQGIPTSRLTGLDNCTTTPQTPAPSIQANWTAPYQNPLHDNDWEVTVYAPDGECLMVGADLPLAQFASLISQAPLAAGSYPLLLYDDTSNDTSLVIAAGSTGKDFNSALLVGGPLPALSGKDGKTVLDELQQAESGPTSPGRIGGTIDGVDRLFFVAPVTYPGWTLVELGPQGLFRAQRERPPARHQQQAQQHRPGRDLDRRAPAGGGIRAGHAALPVRGRPGAGADGLGRASRQGAHRREGALPGEG